MSMPSRFDALLPFHVNGTLAGDDLIEVERRLHEDPQAEAEREWLQDIQALLNEEHAAVRDDVGLERALERIRIDGPPPHVEPPPSKSFAARLLRALGFRTEHGPR